MMRTAVGTLLGLALVLLPIRINAQAGGLGCFVEGNNPGVATCEIADDCGLVGGTDCTNGLCICQGGSLSPFCACAATGPAAAAPVVGGTGLIALIALLGAVGVFGLWRRTGDQQLAS